MAATTLKQYWTDEVTRLTNRLAAQRAEVSAQRSTLTASQALQLSASAAVKTQAAAVDAARKALAGIPMPADGDPLLVAMELALVGLADAQADLASAEMAVQTLNAELARKEALAATMEAALADAKRKLDAATKDTATRQKWIDTLTSGDLATLAADAGAALASHEATARARVEGEFPSSGTNSKHFLKRARARRGLVVDSHKSALAVEGAAFTADTSALAQAQRAFDIAAAAVRMAADAAPRLEADRAVLKKLAELPAPNPPTSYPIVTRWQHDRLHDATKKTARENALAKLTDVDNAVVAARTAQQAYDTALHAAMKADPDKTQAELDAGPVATERGTLNTKLADVATARGLLTADDLATVKAWFAAVPDTLWQALDKLDTAVARLQALAGPPTPANLISTMTAAEATLAAALEAERLAQRKLMASSDALLRAAGLLAAERETVNQRALAYEHSAALL
ncbi:MAG: hypothetical protein AB1430_13170 [Pseudomonadota bacterium]